MPCNQELKPSQSTTSSSRAHTLLNLFSLSTDHPPTLKTIPALAAPTGQQRLGWRKGGARFLLENICWVMRYVHTNEKGGSAFLICSHVFCVTANSAIFRRLFLNSRCTSVVKGAPAVIYLFRTSRIPCGQGCQPLHK